MTLADHSPRIPAVYAIMMAASTPNGMPVDSEVLGLWVFRLMVPQSHP